MTPRDAILELKARMSQDIVGQEHILERLLIGLLANGNLLVEGLPGLAIRKFELFNPLKKGNPKSLSLFNPMEEITNDGPSRLLSPRSTALNPIGKQAAHRPILFL